jgi:hypothetical protein
MESVISICVILVTKDQATQLSFFLVLVQGILTCNAIWLTLHYNKDP